MEWLGKIFGTICGFLLLGPKGGLIGLFIGHIFDSKFRLSYTKAHPFSFFGTLNKTKKLYFYTLFACIGHISKSDGRVSDDEIKVTRDLMRKLKLNSEQTAAAMDAFRAGKDPNFNIHFYLRQLKEKTNGEKNILNSFVEYQIQAAYADGELSEKEISILNTISYSLGINKREFNKILKKFQARFEFQQQFEQNKYHQKNKKKYQQNGQYNQYQQNFTQNNEQISLKNAYLLLNAKETDDASSVKRAYRKQMNQCHPDKLAAKGLPDDLIKSATEKTQNIKEAYEIIKRSKGWK